MIFMQKFAFGPVTFERSLAAKFREVEPYLVATAAVLFTLTVVGG
jgi:hypothetical protein